MTTGDNTLVKHLKTDYTQAALDAQDKAMLAFAVKLTHEPETATQDDVTALKQAGFTEEQVVDIVLITCLFNFFNRLTLGLGVELDEHILSLVRQNSDNG